MNISIPDRLKRRLDRAPGVNWSAVAAAAFEERLSLIANRRTADWYERNKACFIQLLETALATSGIEWRRAIVAVYFAMCTGPKFVPDDIHVAVIQVIEAIERSKGMLEFPTWLGAPTRDEAGIP